MSSAPAAIGVAVALFVGTNLDDIVALALLNASSSATGRPRRWHIWVGQYVGLGILVAVSAIASVGLAAVLGGWIWTIGLIPLTLGVIRLIAAIRSHGAGVGNVSAAAHGILGVVGLTLANGGDNLAAYTPVFHTLSPAEFTITMGVFAVGVAVWCTLGRIVVSHRRVTAALQSWGRWIIPAVYIAIGLWVIAKGWMPHP
ncbi:cadmium resistance transporter [Microbacterium sp. ASV49]|uniref:Cadmium resistance transporter n=1 Tax=Microbacterium candidum TaxID=3041922 RepID=A0ABT7MVG5_9MICO|nr:cadmium resistance transporter [Microbacterium sp. ASV49]MDL9978444.1 cadmium resistance transporter [Microbacterium sp. ASV49]